MSWRTYGLKPCQPNGFTHFYEFGVLTGDSIIDVLSLHSTKIERTFGFDSFMGLPAVPPDEIKQEGWGEGEMSSCQQLECDIDEVVYKILRKIDNPNVTLIPGFYEESLIDSLVSQFDMQPAFYVDIDCDLYSSTVTALDFMCRNKLIQPGTYVGYDDWGGTVGWQSCLSGESLAHTQIAKKYGLQFKQIIQLGNSYPHVQKVFMCVK